MTFIDKLEKKFGKICIPNLMLYLIILYAVGFVIQTVNPGFYIEYLSLNAERILHGEVWRIISYLLYPPSSNVLLLILLSLIYFSLGKTLESVWGSFKFNLYIFVGILGNVIAAIIIYLVWGSVYLLTADKLYLSMLLAMAATFPDMRFYIYFILPVKAKWLGIFYAAFLGYQVVMSIINKDWPGVVALVLSLLNFAIFFFFIRKSKRSGQTKAQAVFKEKMREAVAKQKEEQRRANMPRHRCAICGITDIDNPNIEFRFCSKCDGNFEYCSEHLYTHQHVKKP